jgi:hypothetical protein
LFDKVKEFEEAIIPQTNLKKDYLLRIYKLYREEHDNRENKMLLNIYDYSKENPFDQAAFLIGAAHRNSIVKKITECDKKEKLKLNWALHNAW